jgi:hypothetical protein
MSDGEAFKRWYEKHKNLHHERVTRCRRKRMLNKWVGTKWEDYYRKKKLKGG